MNYSIGNLVYIPSQQSSGIITDICVINETRTIDDLWCTQILVQETLYKVLVLGKVITLTKSLIQKHRE